MSKSGYLEKQKVSRQVCLDIGAEFGRQQILDMMSLVLNDTKVMGKDTFGKKRLLKIVNAIGERIDFYSKAWGVDDETDYYRSKLDKALSSIYGKELHESFLKRYEFMKEFDYKKGKWK